MSGNPRKKPIDNLNCIDLFAGAGGFSYAAQSVGFDVRLAIEFDKHAAATYQANVSSRQQYAPVLMTDDITNICPNEIRGELYQPDEVCDLLLGGPPCQGFSTHRIKDAGVLDERNALILTYFSFVRAFKPTVFLMENVPGILWERHRAYLDEFYSAGDAAGYDVLQPVSLDARDFGLPQRRKRVFILGVARDVAKRDIQWPPQKTHGSASAQKQNPRLKNWASCASVFSRPVPEDSNNVHMNHGPELTAAFKNTPPNGGSRAQSGRTLNCHKEHDGHKDVYGRIDPRQPAPTMTTACINPSKGRFVHPTKHHGITVRQAARIQTFPDEFIFRGGLTAAGKQIGNAVPIELGKTLISHLKDQMLFRHQTLSEAA